MTEMPARVLFGYPVLDATIEEAVDLCEDTISSGRTLQVGVLNAAKIVNANKDPLLKRALLDCDAIFADGQAVVWASRLMGRPLAQRVAGIDLFESLLALADRNGYSVYLLGATREVLDEVVRVVRHKYPNARVAGSHDGYFAIDQAADVAAEIAASSADMLFVAITSPKKETFMAAHGQAMGVHVTHGVGGSFDILAGKTERAPAVWQKAGMEWAFRVIQEPRRMFMRYLRTNVAFIAMVLSDAVRSRVLTVIQLERN